MCGTAAGTSSVSALLHFSCCSITRILSFRSKRHRNDFLVVYLPISDTAEICYHTWSWDWDKNLSIRGKILYWVMRKEYGAALTVRNYTIYIYFRSVSCSHCLPRGVHHCYFSCFSSPPRQPLWVGELYEVMEWPMQSNGSIATVLFNGWDVAFIPSVVYWELTTWMLYLAYEISIGWIHQAVSHY